MHPLLGARDTGIGLRDGGEQGLAVRVQRVVDQAGGQGHLDQATQVHHGDAPLPGKVLGQGQVVGDKKKGDAQLVLEAGEHVQQTDPDGHIHHGHRLIGDDEARMHGEGPRYGHPLPLAAGELMGVLVQEILRRCHVHDPQKLAQTARHRRLVGHQPMAQKGGAENPGHLMHRVQRGVRVLVDDLHGLAIALKIPPHGPNVLPLEENLAAGRPEQASDHLARGRLAAATLPHQADNLALVDVQGDVVHRLDDTVGLAEGAADVLQTDKTAHGVTPP